jgi:hypothetical protein
MDTPPTPAPAAAGRSFGPWLLVIIAGLFAVLGVINLVAQLMYEVKGVQASGQVLSFERASGRSRSVYAKVLAAPPGTTPFKWDVEDTFGVHDWQEGGSVPLLCAHIHADHVSCVIDSYPNRYLWQIMLTFFGGGLAFFGARALIRRTGMSGAITESPSP